MLLGGSTPYIPQYPGEEVQPNKCCHLAAADHSIRITTWLCGAAQITQQVAQLGRKDQHWADFTAVQIQ